MSNKTYYEFDDCREDIGDVIKIIREKEGLSQKEFSEKYGIKERSLEQTERGDSVYGISLLRVICKAKNYSVKILIQEN